MTQRIVSRDEWLKERRALLRDEKAFMRLKDYLAARRRELPWVKVEKAYEFEAPNGKATLDELFEGRSQLIVYHFMFAPSWEDGCAGCTEVADNFNGVIAHIESRDASMVAISRAPLSKLSTYAQRMGWSFDWVSSENSDFNYDYNVSYREPGKSRKMWNFEDVEVELEETHGVSIFVKEGDAIYHTYSCYARSVDLLSCNLQYLDLLPKGRQDDLYVPRPRK